MADLREIEKALREIGACGEQERTREVLHILRGLPRLPECLKLFELGYEIILQIPDQGYKRRMVLELSEDILPEGVFIPLFEKVINDAITAADAIDEKHRRTTELLRLAACLPRTERFRESRYRAWRLALELSEKPGHKQYPLEFYAKELPKQSDLAFYQRYTLLGVARELANDGEFPELYREAIELAIEAAHVIPEPYYKKFSLMYIVNELSGKPGFEEIIRACFESSIDAALSLKDPFAREHALIELLQALPRQADYFPLLKKVLEQALAFFTIRNWMEDVEVLDVVDYILSAEEHGINDSKKKRYSRERYSKLVSKELDGIAPLLNDLSFIEVLKPYNHVWVQPKELRESVKRAIDHLESLRTAFHGKEIERPVFLMELYPETNSGVTRNKNFGLRDCVAIDLGATNTVVMRKKGNAQPEFVHFDNGILKHYGEAAVVPTVLSAETNSIGAAVNPENAVVNIKKLLLDGNPKGRDYMERYFRLLYQHVKKSIAASGWFSMRKNISEVMYITVPVGFQDYKNSLSRIVEQNAKGVNFDFIEEPLAAAVGYQVAEQKDKIILLIDFGGSTLHVMMVRVSVNEVHVIAKPDRSRVLGGSDIDMWLAGYLAREAGIHVPEGKELPGKLVAEAEKIKIALSKSNEAPLEWENRVACRVFRSDFEEVLNNNDFYDIVDREVSYVLRKAEKVGIRKNRVEAVLLTGGSSQIPSFKDKIGGIFPELRDANYIFDHSPLTAVGKGAAMYGTRDVIDRHLGIAYAIRYATKNKEKPFSYAIILEKGEPLPLEKTFRVKTAQFLGPQSEAMLEFYEIPESFITRRWVMESGMEFIKQELREPVDIAINSFKSISLPLSGPIDEFDVTFHVGESGMLSVRYGPDNKELHTEIRLQ